MVLLSNLTLILLYIFWDLQTKFKKLGKILVRIFNKMQWILFFEISFIMHNKMLRNFYSVRMYNGLGPIHSYLYIYNLYIHNYFFKNSSQ